MQRSKHGGRVVTRPFWAKALVVCLVGFLFSFFLLFGLRAPHEHTKPKVGVNFEIFLSEDVAHRPQCFHIHHWILSLTFMLFLALILIILWVRPNLVIVLLV